MSCRHLFLILLFLLARPTLAATTADPLQSVMWDVMQRTVLAGEPAVFDDRVRVTLPRQVEDGQRVPVSIDARALGEVKQLLLFADYNPLPLALRLTPAAGVQARLSVAMRVNQATPVRAAAQTADGVWHVGGQLVDAPGGGCALPTPTRSTTDWGSELGKVYGRLWRENGALRTRIRVMHPMDTGLVDALPRFHLQTLALQDAAGQPLASLQLEPPLAENPLLTLYLADTVATPLRLSGQDSDGNLLHGQLGETP